MEPPFHLFRWLNALLGVFVFSGLVQAATVPLASSESRPPTAEEQASLDRAIEGQARDFGRWAYTQTTEQKDRKGRSKGETVVRFDPSKPYPEQWTPLMVAGKKPSDRDRAKFRRKGERAERDEENPDAKGRLKSLGELTDFRRAQVASVDERHLTFEVPLRPENNQRFPPEKFQVFARLNKTSGLLEHVAVTLRESFCTKVVVTVKSGDASLDFEVIDPKYAPTLTTIRGDAAASVLFFSVGGTFDLKRKDFKRVTPYHDRFGVEIGPLKAIDF